MWKSDYIFGNTGLDAYFGNTGLDAYFVFINSIIIIQQINVWINAANNFKGQWLPLKNAANNFP